MEEKDAEITRRLSIDNGAVQHCAKGAGNVNLLQSRNYWVSLLDVDLQHAAKSRFFSSLLSSAQLPDLRISTLPRMSAVYELENVEACVEGSTHSLRGVFKH